MKKIVTFKCRKYDSLSVPLYHIYVYDINNNLITDKYTNNIGNIKIIWMSIRSTCYFFSNV